MVFEGLVGLGIAFLFGVALAEYSKMRAKADKGFNWLAMAGVFFLFAGSFTLATSLGGYIGAGAWASLGMLFETIGWLFALVGTVFVAYQLLVEK